MGGVKTRQRLASAAHALPSTERIRDPQLRAYLDNRWNWLSMLAAVTMLAITWPVLAEVLSVPAYVLPVLALPSVVPLLGVAAGRGPVLAGWILIIVTCVITAPLPALPGNDDFRIAVPQFLILLVMTAAALLTQPPARLPLIWLVTALTLLVCLTPDLAIGWISSLAVISIGIAFLRYWLRSRREIAEQTEQTELARAREEVLAERSRIARELHDIVAHRMSMVVVMAQTAPYRLAAADQPEDVSAPVTAEFEAIAAAARESLDEVRALLGVLRTGDTRVPDAAVDPPAPGLGNVAELIDDVRAAGVRIDFDDRSDHAAVGDAAGLVVYRIVQESLSNAVRYAPGAAISVSITAGDTSVSRKPLRVSIRNERSTAGFTVADSRRAGLGIRGMIERASALGGSVVAEPTDDGGFAVIAVVPARVS